MAYLGNTPTTQSFISGTDYFNGDGSTIAFTLTRTVNSVNDIEAVINNVVQQPNTAYTLSGTTITFTSAPSAGTGNIYVRYLSTTTQSITPSQNTVSYSSLNSDNQSKLGISFKNRIINGTMTIDQRNAGAAVTPANGASTYTVDRWAYYVNQASKLTAQQSNTSATGFSYSLLTTSSSSYSVGAADVFVLYQPIEGYNIADLSFGTSNAKTITLSFWVRSSITGTFGGCLANTGNTRGYPFSFAINSANTFEQKSITIPGDTSGSWNATNGVGLNLKFNLGAGSNYIGTANTWNSADVVAPSGCVNLVGTSGATLYITGVQIEVGTQATTFDYRDYTRELSMCQRYFIEMAAQTNNYQSITLGSMYSLTGGSYLMYLPVPMRTVPSLTTAQQLWMQNANINVSSFAGPYSQVGSILEGDFLIASNWTAGSVGLIRYNNQSGTKKFSLSAEL